MTLADLKADPGFGGVYKELIRDRTVCDENASSGLSMNCESGRIDFSTAVPQAFSSYFGLGITISSW